MILFGGIFCISLRYFLYGLIKMPIPVGSVHAFSLKHQTYFMDKREGMCFVLKLLFAFSRTKFARSRAHVCLFVFSKKEAIRVTTKNFMVLKY